MIKAVVFDMDGLLLDSEVYWEQARREYCASQGCNWTAQHELTVKGNNSPEWATRIRDTCDLQSGLDDIIRDVSRRMKDLYHHHLPLLPGATWIVQELATDYPLGLASSSPLELIEFALTEAGIRGCFSTVVSADDVGRGKPAPDVFLVTASKMGFPPENIAVFEDSSAGITAAHRAGTLVFAVPNPHYPPSDSALQQADRVLASLLSFQKSMLHDTHAAGSET